MAEPSKHHRRVPTWLVLVVGAVLTVLGLLWTSTLYDDRGNELLDGPTATVLVALLGLVGTLLTLLLQRTREVQHQVTNSHKENLRDDLDLKHREVLDRMERIEAAHRRHGTEITQLREDQQQTRADLSGQASDIRGIRRDVGRLLDLITGREL